MAAQGTGSAALSVYIPVAHRPMSGISGTLRGHRNKEVQNLNTCNTLRDYKEEINGRS